jgi:hypothetical protein
VNDPHLSTAGWTAFHFAADRHHVACAVALLHAGASWQMPAQSHDGRRPRVPDAVKQKIRCLSHALKLLTCVFVVIAFVGDDVYGRSCSECVLTQQTCRAAQRLAFATSSLGVATQENSRNGGASVLFLLAPDLLAE